jgi:hypothetical protein
MQIASSIPQKWRGPLLWGGILLADFALCYWVGTRVAPFVSPFVQLYGALFNFVIHPPFPSQWDYPHQ